MVAGSLAFVASATVATTALIVWLRRTRKLGFSLPVRYELWNAAGEELPDNPTAAWLEQARDARRTRQDVFTALEALRGARPSWSTKAAVIVCEDTARSTVDSGLIPLRVFLPRTTPSNELLPMCVFFHGGGWVYGGSGSHDHIARYFAAQGVVTVMVDYRLSPEHKYPIPVADCLDALRWASRSADELGCNPTRLIVAGDSAGGNLALATCLKARDQNFAGFSEGVGSIAGMLLVYPCVSRRAATSEGGSYSMFANGYGLTRARMTWFWKQFAGVDPAAPFEGDDMMYLAPLDTRTSLHALPPCKVLLADHDVLRDEGQQLVRQLRSAGVHCSLDVVPYTLHGLFSNRRLDVDAWEVFVGKALKWMIRATEA